MAPSLKTKFETTLSSKTIDFDQPLPRFLGSQTLSTLFLSEEGGLKILSQNFMQIGPKIDEIGAYACIEYITIYCYSNYLDF